MLLIWDLHITLLLSLFIPCGFGLEFLLGSIMAQAFWLGTAFLSAMVSCRVLGCVETRFVLLPHRSGGWKVEKLLSPQVLATTFTIVLNTASLRLPNGVVPCMAMH